MQELDAIVEELQLHRPMFPPNGWRVILGSTNRKGRHTIKELPVMGLVWNIDPESVTGHIDFIVWFCCEAMYLSSIKDNNHCVNYTWPVAPTESFDEALRRASKWLEESKTDSLEILEGLNKAA